MKTQINKHRRQKKQTILGNLDLILKEFELAYNLGPALGPKAREELKRRFLEIFDSMPQRYESIQKFSFRFEDLINYQES